MAPRPFQFLFALGFAATLGLASARATTPITFTRDEVTTMANLFETDSVSISALANSQYPSIAGTWDFIFPHTSISSDGDVHIDMAINSSGTGSTGNNTGASPIVTEIINATQTQLSHIDGLSNQQATFRGIFRFYTEHSSERHFELHPVTLLQLWNGSSFVTDSDYHSNIVSDPDGTTHSSSTLISVLDGSSTMTAAIAADNINVNFTFPSPSVNYTQYAGVTTSAVQTDALGQYFFFKPNLVPSANVRCRLIANSAAATAAANFGSNQSLTINALTRTDMAIVASQISTMSAGQQATFARPIELIVLGLPGIGPSPTPTATATPSVTPTATPSPSGSPTPTATPTVTPTGTPNGNTFANSSAITFSGAGAGAGSPYPVTIFVSGLVGKISKVTAQLVGVTGATSNDWGSDLDIQMVGPLGQNVMLISDAGGTHRINGATFTFDDAATGSLSRTNTLTSGTFKPTNYTGDSDAFPSPAPSATPGILLSAYNNTNPNGTWSLFVLDQFSSGRGTITGGWSITFATNPAAPDVITNAATAVTSSTTILNGTVNPLGAITTYQFQIGPTISYGFTQLLQSAGTGTAATPVSFNLTGLKPATTYHFRLIGANETGTTFGTDKTFITPAFVDSDSDGMPDDYESANGFNPNDGTDGAADSDGDGMTNLQEYLAGTNPHSAASVLRITSVDKSAGDITITFPSVLGKTYAVEEAPTPAGPWTSLTDGLAGTGDLINVVDVEAVDSAAQRYYQVKVTP